MNVTNLAKIKVHPSFFLLPKADYSTSEMLVNMGNLPLDEFYPAVAIVTLMRILRDPSLSNHHTMVVQAVTFIFKSLGLKCVQFLPQVMPTFLNVIRVCDASIREVSRITCNTGSIRKFEERGCLVDLFSVYLWLMLVILKANLLTVLFLFSSSFSSRWEWWCAL